LEERTLLSAGDLDPTFGNGGLVTTGFPGSPSLRAQSVALQADGRVVVVGFASSSSRSFQMAVARYDSDGTLDSTFGNGGTVATSFPGWPEAYAGGVAVQPDGEIVVAGYTASGSGEARHYQMALARYNADGSLDESFGTSGLVTTPFPGYSSAIANALALQPDGRIVVAGKASTPPQVPSDRIAVARYNPDGSLDRSFGSGGTLVTELPRSNSYAYSAVVQSDGRIVIGGFILFFGESGYRFALARYGADGTPDGSFGTDGLVTTAFPGFSSAAAYAVTLQADGRAIAVGTANVNSQDSFALARYDTDGSLDPSFGTQGLVTTSLPGTSDDAYTAILQPDGRIIVAGASFANGSQFALARYASDGNLDSSFGADGLVTTAFPGFSGARVTGVALQPDGRIVAAGDVTSATSRFAVARYQGDASTATHFAVSAPVEVTAGQPFDVTVSAVDDNGNVVPDYAGTVTLSSTDPLAPTLGSHTFTTADGGVYTFSAVQLYTAGPQSLLADDGNLNGQADLTVDPGLAVAIVLTGPDHVTAGVPFVVTVTAVDAWGNVATGYRGNVWLEATDPDANLPDAWDFTADDAGSHDFIVTLNTPGPVRLTAHDSDAGWDANLDLVVT
jgi:uncharacterized delta-60 repeat protein